MIMTAEDYLDLVTVNKDIQLGKYVPDYSMALFRDVLENRIGETFQIKQCREMFDAIYEHLDKTGTINFTNVEIHFAIQPESMVQYVSPYNKNYKVGNTAKFIHEKIVWIYRPEAIHAGYINETTYTDSNGKRENNSHKFGTVDEMWNIVVLHTHEKNDTSKEHTEFSTIHITIYYPVSKIFFKEISELYQARQIAQKRIEENRQKMLTKSKKIKKPKFKLKHSKTK